MARSSPRIASGLCLVGAGLFRSPHVSAVSKQINSAPYRFSATDSCRCLCASVRAWPCESGSNPRVSSTRPAFPQLRRSPPIPSLPWLLAADLFRSRSAQLEALPCHSVASRCAWIPVPSLLRRLTGGRFQAVLCRFAAVAFHPFPLRCSSVGSAPRLSNSRQFTDLPLKAMAFPCRSQLIPSTPFRLCPCRIVWPRRHAVSILIVSALSSTAPRSALSALVMSEPFRFGSCRIESQRLHLHAHHLASIRCPVNSPRRVCHHLHGFANRGRAMQFRCLSTHLSPRRSWPFRFAASACVSFPFRCSAFYTSPCLSASLRLTSPPCVAVSPHVGQIPALLRLVN